ncbi:MULTISPECIES: PaaX family transcriptional regulator [Actinomycetes]|uniref:PaaX family transcriptional regulator C-terminal domain-containing protein n=2 Tax=Actinomycetes TaxID=1760 RepID=A0ABP6LYF5_9MICC
MPRPPLPSHRDLLLTVFGLYGRGTDGWIPVAHLVQLLADTGVEPSGVRASISRLLKKGTLINRRQGQHSEYRLSPELHDAFSAGDQRIFAPRHASMDDPWLLAAFTLSETQRGLRHRIRSGLTKLGFGTVAPGLWIAPVHLKEEAEDYFSRHALDEHVIFFRAELTGDRRPRPEWWNLELLEQQYERFVANHSALLDDVRSRVLSPNEAFALYIPTLTHWRGLPYLDPGLPPEILPERWHGQDARRLFTDLHEALAEPSSRHAHAVLGH